MPGPGADVDRLEEKVRKQEAQEAESGDDLDWNSFSSLPDGGCKLWAGLLGLSILDVPLSKSTVVSQCHSELCLGLLQLGLELVVGHLGSSGDRGRDWREGCGWGFLL